MGVVDDDVYREAEKDADITVTHDDSRPWRRRRPSPDPSACARSWERRASRACPRSGSPSWPRRAVSQQNADLMKSLDAAFWPGRRAHRAGDGRRDRLERGRGLPLRRKTPRRPAGRPRGRVHATRRRVGRLAVALEEVDDVGQTRRGDGPRRRRVQEDGAEDRCAVRRRLEAARREGRRLPAGHRQPWRSTKAVSGRQRLQEVLDHAPVRAASDDVGVVVAGAGDGEEALRPRRRVEDAAPLARTERPRPVAVEHEQGHREVAEPSPRRRSGCGRTATAAGTGTPRAPSLGTDANGDEHERGRPGAARDRSATAEPSDSPKITERSSGTLFSTITQRGAARRRGTSLFVRRSSPVRSPVVEEVAAAVAFTEEERAVEPRATSPSRRGEQTWPRGRRRGEVPACDLTLPPSARGLEGEAAGDAARRRGAVAGDAASSREQHDRWRHDGGAVMRRRATPLGFATTPRVPLTWKEARLFPSRRPSPRSCFIRSRRRGCP